VNEVANIRSLRKPVSIEERLLQLEAEGIVIPPSENPPSLDEVLRELKEEWRSNPPKPGGLARFLELRG